MKPETTRFRELASRSSENKELRAVLGKAAGLFNRLRTSALAATPHLDEVKQRAAAARRRSLSMLPELLETLEKNVRAAGGEVHFAEDAAAARRIIVDIAKAGGVKLAVKGKSMVSEEVRLNMGLEEAGIEAVETDLGEYIIQIAGEAPSHLIAPAFHLSRADIQELFEKHIDYKGSGEHEDLTRAARRSLREKFLAADMGVTGGNMAVAETGSVCLIENEGNIRISGTCPRVHVALVTIEKVVATLEDMSAVLDLLPRTATGQKMPTYFSVFTGPRREGEQDGPESFHLVLLDNGRSRILGDPATQGILSCVRCGACLNVCPVYRAIGGHGYGWIYSGPMGSVLSPLLLPGQADDLPFACTSCGACAEVCPAGVDHPKILQELRRRLTGAGCATPVGGSWQGVFGFLAARHPFYRLAGDAVRALDRAGMGADKLAASGLAPRLAAWSRTRKPPRPKTPFSRRWKKLARTLNNGDPK